MVHGYTLPICEMSILYHIDQLYEYNITISLPLYRDSILKRGEMTTFLITGLSNMLSISFSILHATNLLIRFTIHE